MSGSLLASPARRAAQARLVPSPAKRAAQPLTHHDSPASAASDRTAALESRLQQTNARIGQLLDQMSWREEDDSNRNTGAADGGREEMDAEAATAAAAPSAIAAAASLSSSASPSSVSSAASLLSTCRPFDRSAFLARVASFSPLRWMHRAQTETALSPITMARFGWIASAAAIDTVVCPLCAVEVTLHFAPEVLALSDTAPIRALARQYATQVLPSSHAANCAWNLAQADLDFTRIVPGGVSRSGEVSANRRAVVLGQAEQRALSLTKRAPQEFWRTFTVASSFVEAARELLQARSIPVNPAVDPIANLDLTMLLALCGWEIRSPVATAAAESASAPPSVLQCCFGCREVGALERFCSEPSETELAAAESAGNDAAEDEERSELQSPIKRRRTDSSKVMSRTSSAVAPAAPIVRVRTSSAGFHAAREHRPFCPFVQPLAEESEEAAVSAASASSASSGEQKHQPPASSAPESCFVGWQQVLAWFHERTLSKAAQMQQGDEECEAALADVGAPAASASSSLPHKERQFQSAITTVRKLLQAHAK